MGARRRVTASVLTAKPRRFHRGQRDFGLHAMSSRSIGRRPGNLRAAGFPACCVVGNIAREIQTSRTMNALARTWTVWIARGIASVLFGVLTLVSPGASISAIVLLFGVYALADGAMLLGFAFRYGGRKAPYIVRGLLSIAAGLLTFVFPGLTAISLYILVGAWAISAGIAEIAIAIAIRNEATSISGIVVAGVLSLACGVALLALPMAGVIALVSLIAAYAIVNGVAFISAGIRIHKLVGPLSAA